MLSPYLDISPLSAGLGAIALVVALALWTYRFLHFRGLPSPPLSLFEAQDEPPKRGLIGEVYREWFDKYGSTLALRVGPRYRPVILSSDPGFAAYVAHHVDDFEISARLGKMTAKNWGMNMSIACALGKDRRRVKRIYESTFSVHAMRDYFPDILAVVRRGKDSIQASQEVMGFETMRRIMVDITQKVGMGEDSNSIETGQRTEIEDAIRDWQQSRAKDLASQKSIRKWFPKSPFASESQPFLHPKMSNVLTAASAIGARKQAEVKSGYTNKQGYLATLCRNTLDDIKPSHRMTEEEVAHNIPILFIASTDVTCMAFRMMLHLLAIHPHVQTKLRKELQTLSENPTLDELTGGYLDAVIDESLRVWQPYTNIEREATQDSVVPLTYPVKRGSRTIDSVSIKKGDEVWISMSAINFNQALFGEDVKVFRPDRFLDGSVTAEAEKLAGTWGKGIGFWAGGRGCPVFNYPVACARAILFVMIRSFELSEPPSGQAIKRYHGQTAVDINGKSQFDFPIIFKPIKTA